MGKLEVITHPLIQHKLSISSSVQIPLRGHFRELVDRDCYIDRLQVL